MSNPTASILDRFGERLASPEFRRADLAIADWRILDNDSAKALFSYDNRFGNPSMQDVMAAVARNLDGQFSAIQGSARIHEKAGAVSVVVARSTETLPATAAAGMMALGGTQFMNQEIGDIWKMETGDDGVRFMRRVSKDDIGQILAARKQRMGSASPVRAFFGEHVSASVAICNPGDEVQFWADQKLRTGIVSAVGGMAVSIKSEGQQYDVQREAVLAFVKMGPQSEQVVRDQLREQFNQYLPPEYVDTLLSGTLAL